MLNLLRNLGDGLILRRAAIADAEKLIEFNQNTHGDVDTPGDRERLGAWVRDLLTSPHPTFRPEDFTIVEDAHTGDIVSSLNLISQRWTYDGIEFGVGRPELVGTRPDCRRKGLVRLQMETVHAWSAERGELMQGITGIPYYYRQFGYEMGLDLGGARIGYEPHLPKLKEGEAEPYRVRPAAESDLPFIAEMYARGAARSLVACARDETVWRYELLHRSPANINGRQLRIIESVEGAPVGFLAHPGYVWSPAMMATFYELKPGVSYLAVTPSVARYLWAAGQTYSARDKSDHQAFGFHLGPEHPVYEAFGDKLPRPWKPYAWYIRVPDLPAFLRRIAPALEKRLSVSPFAGHSGELTLSFYRDGVQLVFEAGRLAAVERWQPAPDSRNPHADANFPDLTFLHVLFGHRSLDELEHVFRDCWSKEDSTRELVKALFPKRASYVWPVD
jgi:hypothetical protein